MKFLLAAIAFTLVSSSFASEMIGIFKDAAHPNKCVFEGLVLSPGEQGQPKGKCSILMCHNETGFGTAQDCGVQATGPHCKLGERINPNGPYPDCCERHSICD